jgi:hypothetical protein
MRVRWIPYRWPPVGSALVVDNLATSGVVSASSQVLTMPAANLLTPHTTDRWRSLTNSDYFVLNKGSPIVADTFMAGRLTCGVNSTARLLLSTSDSSGAAGDVLDTGLIATGTRNFDVGLYNSFVWRLPSPAAWQYARFELTDPDAAIVEAGFAVDGLSEPFDYSFAPGSSIQDVDRSRVTPTSAGLTLTWQDNTFRRLDLHFDWVSERQRNGMIARLDRVKGRHTNVLLLTNTNETNLPRAAIFGLVTDQTPVTFGAATKIYGKQLRIDERL